MKKESNLMPDSTFIIKGNIQDFTRLDNLYKALKREAEKLLTDWQLNVTVTYEEKKDELTE